MSDPPRAPVRAVAIDGPAGAGKSTVARGVADCLGFLYVDTGAMYRAVTVKAREMDLDLEDPEAMGRAARAADLRFDGSGTRILLDGRDVSRLIRDPELTASVRYAARAAPVRAELVRRQREMAGERPVVMEGRDITTVVLPEARWRCLLTADPRVRARRRWEELRRDGHEADYERILADLLERDASDHKVGALLEAERIAEAGGGIVRIDTTETPAGTVVEEIVRSVEADPC